MIQLRLGRPTAKRNLRTKVSKPQKPTILDWSHQPHHRRLPRQRFSAMTRYGTGGGQVGITAPDPRAEIMARVWPNTFIEESNLKVQVPGLRRALGGVSQSRGISMARSDPLLRENAPETGNLIVPRIERWPVQLERNALTDYQNPDEPRVVSGKHYMHRPAQGHPDRLSSPNGARRAQSGRDSWAMWASDWLFRPTSRDNRRCRSAISANRRDRESDEIGAQPSWEGAASTGTGTAPAAWWLRVSPGQMPAAANPSDPRGIMRMVRIVPQRIVSLRNNVRPAVAQSVKFCRV